MQRNVSKWARWSLLFYLMVLVTVSIIPLGSASRKLTDVTVIHLRGDYFLHMLVYMPILTLMFLSFHKWSWKLFGLALMMAIGLEFIQMVLPYRSFNINDLVANVGGVVLGALIYPLITRLTLR